MAEVIAVFGPTASGKSAAAIELARTLDGEIVSCDAMQLYRGLPILTNQPSEADLAQTPHHLVAVWPLSHEGSVAEFGEMARAAVDDVVGRGRTAILCGGGGLYLRAALAPLELPPPPTPGVRERFAELYDQRGAEATHALLAERDPRAAASVHPNDRRRVVRALELAELGASLVPAEDALWQRHDLRRTLVFGLTVDPGAVNERIAQRTREMFERGVEDEVRSAIRGPLSSTAGRIHGLQDVRALLAGEIGRDEAIARLDGRTRRYAKRQRVWMRRLPDLIAVGSSDEMLARAAA
ncbi:MAG: tRNA dimethylallyltransferase [Gaiellales bacterium]|jgi:tRNA dimethylallyltransferase|nr:tRNA dimethylallyltransferase [Gaiellales bacterium]MDX6546333.1 tRNA dimethylallyltransferase [Gaiellales bacterium]MDX6550616.1 tRNA dimethylallyltransferase [Gaiellales bacterium]